jgi:hypothetical protein
MSVKLSPALAKAVRKLAQSRGVSMSAVIREAIERYLAINACPKEGSFLAVAKDFAGCVEGPTDLASNDEHLAGYGRQVTPTKKSGGS